MKKFILLLFLALPFVSKAQDATWLQVADGSNIWICDTYWNEINPAGYTFLYRVDDLDILFSDLDLFDAVEEVVEEVFKSVDNYKKNKKNIYAVVKFRVDQSFEKCCYLMLELYDKKGNVIYSSGQPDKVSKRDFWEIEQDEQLQYAFAYHGFRLINGWK